MRIPSGVTDQYICSKCKTQKPAEDFHRDKHTARGRKHSCKECTNKSRRGRYSRQNRKAHLKSKYGITPEQYDAMVLHQRGMCPVCRSVPEPRSGGGRAQNSTGLYVDHNHVSGDVRGLLCHKCNVAIGLLYDDPARLERAAAYVRGMPVEFLLEVKQ